MCLPCRLWTSQGKGSLPVCLIWLTVGVNKWPEMNGWTNGWRLPLECAPLSLRGWKLQSRSNCNVRCKPLPARALFHSVPELKHILCRCPLRDCPKLGTVIKEHWETGMGSHLRCFACSGSFFLWLHWVFLPAHGLSLVEVSGGYSSLQCAGFSPQCLLLWSTGSEARRLSSCGARL